MTDASGMMTTSLPDPLPGRVMALDLGEKRIGVALSDETRTLARSYAVIRRSSRQADFAQMAAIAAAQGVALLVVGLPVPLDGQEGALAAWVRDYAADLAHHLQLETILWDESFTTRQASQSMRERGQRAHQQRGRVDAVAAAFLLQDYLDSLARSPAGQAPGNPAETPSTTA